MPYIRQSRRDEIDAFDRVRSAGELNYVFTREAIAYLKNHLAKDGYQAINDVIGALEGAKLELQRRVVAPYEDEAISRNGDLYERLRDR